jgi:hypothetical protein
LPSLRQNLGPRSVGRKKFDKPEDDQVHSLRKLKKLEKRKTLYSRWSDSAFCLPRLRQEIFRAVNYILKIFFFFSANGDRRLFS